MVYAAFLCYANVKQYHIWCHLHPESQDSPDP